MKRVTAAESIGLERFLESDGELNLYIMSMLYKFRQYGSNMDLYIDGKLVNPRGLILRDNRFFLVYSPGIMDYEAAAEIVREFPEAVAIVGQEHCVEGLKTYFVDLILKEHVTNFAVLRHLDLRKTPLMEEVRTALISDGERIIELLSTIGEFPSTDPEDFMRTMKEGCITRYCLERDGRILSTASTSAETGSIAVISDVATAIDCRS